MKLFIDSADIEKIKKGFEFYSLDGITTNPTIIARDIGDYDVKNLLLEIRRISKGTLMFVQATGENSDDYIKSANKIRELLEGDICIKIPIGEEGIKAISTLKKQGISTAATAVYSVSQALTAAHSGADFVAPYISHLDNLCLDGPSEAAKMANTLKLQNFKTEILAASFRTLSQVSKCFENGVTSATVTVEMLKLMVSHPGTDNEIKSFKTNWEAEFGPKSIADLL